MDIRVLEYFLVTAEEENITRAAERLLMTQPTLSRQLKALEEELSTRLFERTNHRIYLTDEGRKFRQRAQDILNLLARAQDELHKEEELSGTLSIGSGELRGMQELSQALAGFQEKYPEVRVALHNGNNDEIREGIDNGTLDVGLLLEPVDVGKYDFVRLKTRERWGILVHKDSGFAQAPAIQPGDLVGTKVLTILDRVVQKELAAWSGEYASEMTNRGRYNLTYNAAMLAKADKGVVISLDLPQRYEDMIFVPFEPQLELTSVLAWRSSTSQSKLVETFLAFFRDFSHSKNV